jgi:hypothetical protein
MKGEPGLSMAEAFERAFSETVGPEPRYLEQINRNIIEAIECRMSIRLNRMVKSMNEEVAHIVRHKHEFIKRREKKMLP